MESLERFTLSKLRQTENTQGKFDDLVEELDKRSVEAQAKFEDLLRQPDPGLDIEKKYIIKIKRSS